MPGTRVTAQQKRQVLTLMVDGGLSPEKAAKQVGISRASAYRISKGVKESPEVDSRRASLDLPEPKAWEQLSDPAKRALEDFGYFRVRYFARRITPAGTRAADRIVESLLDHEDRTFLDFNFFPGAGKTTIFHDIEAWLLAGGGVCDPARGRALRLMLGSETKTVSQHMVARLRRSLELRRPFYDKEQRAYAEGVMALDFGRFKPDSQLGEESLWSKMEFLVAQMEDVDLYEKEPTVQAASRESGFLGERVDLAVWDDLSTTRNSRNPDIASALAEWFENEAESRVEPGGVLALVGQRLGPNDLHRNRLDTMEPGPDGEDRPVYVHIIFQAHRDELCPGDKHEQWDGEDKGCLTDAWRFNASDLRRLSQRQNFRTVYQQEDIDPGRVLVQQAWLDGVPDIDGYPSPGCYDRDRIFGQWPAAVGQTIDYATVDPSAGNWWAAEWWAVQPQTRHNYLIYGQRKKLQAGAFLDWDNREQVFTGLMEEWQVASVLAGHPIRVWIVESNAAHKYLQQFEHYRRWRLKWPDVVVIAHQTQNNKNDAELGVEALMPGRYKTGMKHLPKGPDVAALNYLRVKERELTTYPLSTTDDTVMADWFGEMNLDTILRVGQRPIGGDLEVAPGLKLPRYLQRQFATTRYGQED